MPERVASHFNSAGIANGWMSRDAMLGWQIATTALVAALFQGIVLLQSRLPTEFVNLPNREYWLATERRAMTDTWIRNMVLTVGCLLMIFFMALFHLVYLGNQAATPRLPSGLRSMTVLMLVATSGVIVATFLRFTRKPAP